MHWFRHIYSNKASSQTQKLKIVKMFALITIIAFILSAVQGNTWVTFVVSAIVGVGFAVFEICELFRLKAAVTREFTKKKKQAQQSKMNTKSYENKEHELEMQSMPFQLSQRISRLLHFFTYFPRSPKSPHKGQVHKFFMSTRFGFSRHEHDTQSSMQLQSKPQLQSQSQQLSRLEQDHKLRLQYINKLMLSQLRECAMMVIYTCFVVISIGRQYTHSDTRKISSMISMAKEKASKQQNVLYFVPLLLNCVWKVHRVEIYIDSKTNNRIIKSILKVTLVKSLVAHFDNISIFSASSSQISMHTQRKNTKEDREIIMLLDLMDLQLMIQLCTFFYVSIQCCTQIAQISFIVVGNIWTLALAPAVDWTNCCESMDIFEDLRFVLNRILVIVLICGYLLLRNQASSGKLVSTRNILWRIHIEIDKVIKLISTDLRAMYQRKVHRMVKKLKKHGIIKQTNQCSNTNRDVLNDAHISMYYQSV